MAAPRPRCGPGAALVARHACFATKAALQAAVRWRNALCGRRCKCQTSKPRRLVLVCVHAECAFRVLATVPEWDLVARRWWVGEAVLAHTCAPPPAMARVCDLTLAEWASSGVQEGATRARVRVTCVGGAATVAVPCVGAHVVLVAVGARGVARPPPLLSVVAALPGAVSSRVALATHLSCHQPSLTRVHSGCVDACTPRMCKQLRGHGACLCRGAPPGGCCARALPANAPPQPRVARAVGQPGGGVWPPRSPPRPRTWPVRACARAVVTARVPCVRACCACMPGWTQASVFVVAVHAPQVVSGA